MIWMSEYELLTTDYEAHDAVRNIMSRPTSSAPSQSTGFDRPQTLLLLLFGTMAVLAGGLFLSQGEAHIWWQVVTLGVIEGITEFLPISSTAHLLIAADLLGFQQSMGGTFEIFIQLGAIIAVVLYYARDLLGQAQQFPKSKTVQHFWLAILVAFFPAAALGLLFRGFIKQVLFDSPGLIAATLILGGLALIVIERFWKRPARTHDVEKTTSLQALGIGIAQILALVPGVSRSASSIMGGLFMGLDRKAATAFSFYLSIPTLGAATIVDLLGGLSERTASDFGYLLVGTVVSFVVAWFSIGWLLRYVSRHSFVGFGVYRIIAGLAMIVFIAVGWL
jgi:undecaprenyl-diphosphatase